MYDYKVYQRKTRGAIDKALKNNELQRECSWIPGTPAKLLSRPLERNPVCGFPVVNSEEGEKEACNEATQTCSSDEGRTGTGGLCLYSTGLIDLNKSCDEWQDVDGRFQAKASSSACDKVVDDPGKKPTGFGFNGCRDSSTVQVDEISKDSNFLIPGGSDDGLDEMEGQLSVIPLTQLLTSYNVVTQQVVDWTITVDTQIDTSTKESDVVFKGVDISIPGTLSSTIVDASYSQESANSTTHDVDEVTATFSSVKVSQADSNTEEPDRRNYLLANSDVLLGHSQLKDTNIAENLKKNTNNAESMQTDNSTTESCASPNSQQNVQEDVVSGAGVENLNKQSEKKRRTQQKPKRKKHRPRVAVEGRKPRKVLQPKTPKPVTPKRPSSKETAPSKKRKYVRKSSQQNSVPEDFIDETLPKRRKSSRKTNKNEPVVISELAEKTSKRRAFNFDCRRALSFDLENQSRDETITTPHLLELQVVDECLNISEQSELYVPNRCKKTRSQRRRRLNTLFMPKLNLGGVGIPTKRKRLRRLIRRSNLALLIAPPICNQLPRLSFEKAQTGEKEKEEAEVIREPEARKKIMLRNYYHQRKVMENRRKMGLGFVDLNDEIFLFTAKDRGSPRVMQEERIASAMQANPLEITVKSRNSQQVSHELRNDSVMKKNSLKPKDICLTISRSSQEALQVQKINSVNKKVPPELKLLSRVVKTREEHVQEVRYNSYNQKCLKGSEDVWLVPKSSGSSPGHEVPFSRSTYKYENFKSNFNPDVGSQKVSKEKRISSLIEEEESKEIIFICEQLELLTIKDGGRRSKKKKKHGRNTQGPNSGHGTLVPYQELPIRNRKRISGKVDLDPDTLRVWNQLMNIKDSDGNEEKTDPEKEDRWRREREVFQGRIESFTARMHLILGDRRFKPWKGSVVDSVVGVYLTQNVSDSLSSSAYMSLAAKFPLQTTSNNTANNLASTGAAYDFEGNVYFVTEPEPDRSCELKNRIEPLDSGIEGISLVEPHTFEDSSNVQLIDRIDRIQLSPAFNPQADFASMSKTCTPGSCSCSIELPVLENTTLPQDLHYNGGKISSCEEGQRDMYIASTRMDCGNQASTSGRINELNGDCGFISQPDFYDLEGPRSHMQQAEVATVKSKKTPRGKGPKPKDDKAKKASPKEKKKDNQEQKDWELFRKMYATGEQTSSDCMDSVDWEAVRLAEPKEVAKAIKDRGQHNIIAGRIQDFLNRLIKVHNGIDLEWLRTAPPDIVKEYLLEIPGLGLKSVECVRLLSLQHIAFPVDTNVGRIAVRLGWVPLEPLPESVQIHLLEQYPLMDTIQKYLWPRLCNLDQRTLYELHYQMITFGKVFCTKRNPNCGVCPLRGECKHFASAFASARLALPGPAERGVVKIPNWAKRNPSVDVNPIPVTLLEADLISESGNLTNNCEPIIEEPSSPEPQCTAPMSPELDLEDFSSGELEDIPTIRLQEQEFKENLQNFMQSNKIMLQDSRALVVLAAEAASMPPPKLKSINRLRTEHLVYVLPDNHLMLRGFERREPDDPCPYLLSIWTPGETPNSFEKPINKCNSGESEFCNEQTCYSCNRNREQDADIVRGTILIPCRTANRGRFPLNGTYFQVNEVFADHETSYDPISVPRSMIAHLPTQTAYFGTSATSIFRALDLPEIQRCFWRGYICVRGFDRKIRAPRSLVKRFHTSPSQMGKPSEKWNDE
ncbi:hypothetical protein ACOSQ3_016348 [Xanthoceras sorbifolium]